MRACPVETALLPAAQDPLPGLTAVPITLRASSGDAASALNSFGNWLPLDLNGGT